jgi:hypothetical protein
MEEVMHAPVCRQQVRRFGLRPLGLLAALGLLAMAGSAVAQPSRPSDRMDEPFGRDRAGDRDRGRDRDRDETYAPRDFPSGAVHDAIDSNARATFARLQYQRLQSAMDIRVRQIQYEFEHSQEMADALKAEQQAWDDYVAARRAALKSVVDDPKYQANVALKNEMGDKIAEVRAAYDDHVDHMRPIRDRHIGAAVEQAKMKEVTDMAYVKLDYAQVATDMEVAALKNDGKVADARTKLMSAGARVQGLRDGFDRQLRGNQELATLRGKIADARIASITAETYRNGTVEAANEALDYAYWKNRYNYNNYYNGLGWDYGYGGYMRY